MELVVLARFGKLPDSPAELRERFLEAEWLEERGAKVLARELAEIMKL